MRKVSLIVLLLAVSGCYTYAEVERASLGDKARITLPVADRNEEGEDEPIFAEGTVVTNQRGLSLEQKRVEEAGQFRRVEFLDTLYVPQTEIRRLEVRRLSWTRTVLGSAVLGLLVQAAYTALREEQQRPGR